MGDTRYTPEIAVLTLLLLEVDATINDAIRKVDARDILIRKFRQPLNRADRRTMARQDRQRRRRKARHS